MRPLFHGVYPVLATPFDDVGRLDVDDLAALVRYVVAAGIDGLACNANASEFTALTLAERKQAAATVRAVAPDHPLIVAVTASAAGDALDLARHAAAIGAAAIMAMPPYPYPGGPEEVRAFFVMLASIGLPVMIQNSRPPVGTVLAVDLIADLARSIPLVQAVKEETFDSTHRVSRLQAVNPELVIVGGEGGRFAIEQSDRGSVGIMPASSLPDAHVAIWNALEAGDRDRALTCLAATLPLINLSDHLGPYLHKEILMRRGVIRTTTARQAGFPSCDAIDRIAVQKWLDRLDATLSK
jgi:4-hydroxy-tetrahydrodipicolinate synthase